MEQTYTTGPGKTDKESTIAVNHCVNTNRTYIYEIKNGEIISQQTLHGTK
ncbi:hypothetical protein [Methanooceanicella nereidis]|nr:hypothetical protein [Methanocella sp. CWC-04]